MKHRTLLIKAIFGIWFVAIILRLGYWQFVKGGDLRRQADGEHLTSERLYAPRGQILASDGQPLVTNTERYLFFVDPHLLPSDYETINRLMATLDSSESAKRLDEARQSELSWYWIQKSLTPAQKKRIEDLKIQGVGFESEPIRLYPEGSSSAYLTGFVGQDSQGSPVGYFGLEGFYNRLLTGVDGRISHEQDAFGRPLLLSASSRIQLKPGKTLHTSIDRTIQFIATQKLIAGLQKYQATSGTVSIMETETGRVISLVSWPNYDPANFGKFDTHLYANPIVTEGYEPGSTFKSIIMASALDAGVITRDTICNICSGPVRIYDATVRSWNEKYYKDSNMTDVILHSDNVGMVFVARKLGKLKLLEYVRRFGFGKTTGIDLQEESTPTLRPDSEWFDIDWATAAFGQGIAVTRIQMLAGVNAIANQGLWVEPRIVWQEGLPTQKSRPVISSKAASGVTQMMVNGVNTGEVRYYKPSGYQIAGKTGTAQIPIEGHYDADKFIASFVGFAPADKPKFTMLVTLTDPKTSRWGSTTAAPLWFDIAREVFRYYQIPPNTK